MKYKKTAFILLCTSLGLYFQTPNCFGKSFLKKLKATGKKIEKLARDKLKGKSSMFENIRIIDLTHSIDEHVPTWEGTCGFTTEITLDYDEGARVMEYSMRAGIGTHIDAPSHFVIGGLDVATIPLDTLIVPACVIDVSSKVKKNSTYLISSNDIKEFEKIYGSIEGTFVIGYTGWSKRWPDIKAYRNENETGSMQFPGFSEEAANYLLEKNIIGIGIDTLSIDGINKNFPVHKKILGAGKYIIENLANSNQLPPVGAHIIALPLKIKGGTESAARIIAIVQK